MDLKEFQNRLAAPMRIKDEYDAQITLEQAFSDLDSSWRDALDASLALGRAEERVEYLLERLKSGDFTLPVDPRRLKGYLKEIGRHHDSMSKLLQPLKTLTHEGELVHRESEK